MSGGHFDYQEFHIEQCAESIQHAIDIQGKEKDKLDLFSDREYYKKYPEEKYHYKYPKEVNDEFIKAVKILKTAYIYAKRIDYLLSGDDGEESFLRRLKEELKEFEDKKGNSKR